MGKRKKNIAYMVYFIKDQTNRTQYQRIYNLSENNNVHIFIRKRSKIPSCIRERVYTHVFEKNLLSRFLPFYILWRIYKVINIHKKIKFDLVYTFYQPYSIIEGFIFKLFGFRWVQDIWDHPELPGEIYRVRTKILLYIAKKILRYSDLIICSIYPKSLESFNLIPDKIISVTNGVRLDMIPRYMSVDNNIKKNNKYVVTYVGYVYKSIGLDTLLESINLLRKKYNVKVVLFLIGKIFDDKTKNWLNTFASENGLLNSIVVTGEVDHREVVYLLSKSDICIYPFPRKRELDCIYPIKIFEYMAMGKAVVSTNLTGVSRIIKNGVNGILVEPDNPNEMAWAIYSVLTNPKLRKKLEHNARKTAKKYEWVKIHQKIDNALDVLIANRKSRRKV